MASASDSILKSIKYAVNNAVDKIATCDIKTAVKKITETTSGRIYTISVNGAEYTIPSGNGLIYSVGDLVWVRLPNGSFQDAYIISTITPKEIANSESKSNIDIKTVKDVGKLPSCTLPSITFALDGETLVVTTTNGAFDPGKLATYEDVTTTVDLSRVVSSGHKKARLDDTGAIMDNSQGGLVEK